MKRVTTNRPVAVIISDVHYNINTLDVADKALRLAVQKANYLSVPLIISGDLHDTKANIRGECIKAMIDTISQCDKRVYIIRGNHDSINEKSQEHSLEFLAPYAHIVSKTGSPEPFAELESWMIPYHSDTEELKKALSIVPHGSRIIMHQGVEESDSGEYIRDKTALPRSAYANHRVISGHYHTRQDISCGNNTFSYVGNPYTLTFAEATDPEKGFRILLTNGDMEFVPTNLRKHVKFDIGACYIGDTNNIYFPPCNPDDLLLFRVHGTKEELSKVTKQIISEQFTLPASFKLEFVVRDSETAKVVPKQLSQPELLDALIDSLTNTSDVQKERLKNKWKEYV